jgi:hypothetical protein
MKHICLRALQLAALAIFAIVATPRSSHANEFGCYVICVYDDWECMWKTGHPADPCTYDADQDICNLGGCTLGPIQAQ